MHECRCKGIRRERDLQKVLKQRVNCEEEGKDEIASLLQEGVIYGEGAEC